MPALNMNAWLIWSNEHGKWWKEGGRGYTDKIGDAGVFTAQRARQACERATVGPGWTEDKVDAPEVMVPVPRVFRGWIDSAKVMIEDAEKLGLAVRVHEGGAAEEDLCASLAVTFLKMWTEIERLREVAIVRDLTKET